MGEFKNNSEIILVPVSCDLYWKIFREMKANDPASTFSDNRVTDYNLIVLRLQNRNRVIVIQCKDELLLEKKIDYSLLPEEVKE